MPSIPKEQPWSSGVGPDLLTRASSVLAREVSRLPMTVPGAPGQPPPGGMRAVNAAASVPRSSTGRTCPVTGATLQPATPDPDRLRQQAYDLVALISGRAPATTESPVALAASPEAFPAAAGFGNEIARLGQMVSPALSAAVPLPAPDMDRIRRQAHELIEGLLVTFSQATGEKAAPYEDQVPLLRCEAPVQAGNQGRATMRVANEEDTPSEVTLYCSNFVADVGYEIPSPRIAVSPRSLTIPARGEGSFEIKIAVPQQAPPGIYSGLIQAMGTRYVKAVLSVEVT
jgi:hypothetical protein